MSGPLGQAAVETSELLSKIGVPHCIIGGVALQRWGKPRVTADVDVLAFTGYGQDEQRVIDAFDAAMRPRRVDMRRFALEHRVVLATARNGVGVDVSLGGLDFERDVVARSTPFDLDGSSFPTCSAEDLVVLKAFADRARDWSDIEGIAIRTGDGLDWRVVMDRIRPLAELKESPHILERLRQIRERC